MDILNEVKEKDTDELQSENVRLKNRITELEQQLLVLEERLENAKNYSRLLETEINDINNKYFTVQRTNAELKKKLMEASAVKSPAFSNDFQK